MLEYKGFWPRIAARILDILIIGIPSIFLVSFSFGFSYVTESSDNFIFNITMLIITLIYMILLPVKFHGYTPGKRICGVKIVKRGGEHLTVKVMLKRELFILLVYTLSFGLLAVISIIMTFTREDKRALHDLYAQTFVIEG